MTCIYKIQHQSGEHRGSGGIYRQIHPENVRAGLTKVWKQRSRRNGTRRSIDIFQTAIFADIVGTCKRQDEISDEEFRFAVGSFSELEENFTSEIVRPIVEDHTQQEDSRVANGLRGEKVVNFMGRLGSLIGCLVWGSESQGDEPWNVAVEFNNSGHFAFHACRKVKQRSES